MNIIKDVGFAFQLIKHEAEICDNEVCDMVNKVIFQTLGAKHAKRTKLSKY